MTAHTGDATPRLSQGEGRGDNRRISQGVISGGEGTKDRMLPRHPRSDSPEGKADSVRSTLIGSQAVRLVQASLVSALEQRDRVTEDDGPFWRSTRWLMAPIVQLA